VLYLVSTTSPHIAILSSRHRAPRMDAPCPDWLTRDALTRTEPDRETTGTPVRGKPILLFRRRNGRASLPPLA